MWLAVVIMEAIILCARYAGNPVLVWRFKFHGMSEKLDKDYMQARPIEDINIDEMVGGRFYHCLPLQTDNSTLSGYFSGHQVKQIRQHNEKRAGLVGESAQEQGCCHIAEFLEASLMHSAATTAAASSRLYCTGRSYLLDR